MSSRPKILTLSNDERSALGDLKAAIDVANHVGLLDKLAGVVHPNIVNNFVDAVCQLMERGPKIGAFALGDTLVEVFQSSTVINGHHSVEIVKGNTMTTWHYHELQSEDCHESWHRLVLAMIDYHESRLSKGYRR